VQELEKLKQVSDAEKLKPQEYDSRLARIIQELREKGIDADRAATTAALADAVKRGVITLRCRRTCSAGWAHLAPWKYCSSQATSNTWLQCLPAQRGQAFSEGHALSAVGADPVLVTPGNRRVFGTRHDGPAVRRLADDIEDRPRDVTASRRHRGVLRAARASSLGTTRHGGAGGRCPLAAEPSSASASLPRSCQVHGNPGVACFLSRHRALRSCESAPRADEIARAADACHNNTARGGRVWDFW